MTISRRAAGVGVPLLAILVSAVPVAAQTPVSWSASARETRAKRGSTAIIEVVARIDDGWHLYALAQAPPPIATRITLPEGQSFMLAGRIDASPPRTAFDQSFGIQTAYYEGRAAFLLPVRVADQAQSGLQAVRVQAYFQACNDQLCLPPRTVTLEVSMDVVAESIVRGTSSAPAPASSSSQLSPVRPSPPVPSTARARSGPSTSPVAPQSPGVLASSRVLPSSSRPVSSAAGTPAATSLWSFLWLAMTVGALSLLTPCVFPMVPITVSYFTNHAAGSRRKAVRQAVTYVVGIVLTFTALGMAMALLVGATSLNRFAANPWVNLAITAIFLAFAASLLGVFDLSLPTGLINRLDALTRRKGGSETLATLAMGLTFTLTSFTCTAPFIGTLLVMAAGGAWQWPLAGMLAFSSVFALPFFVLALMPQWMASLPRSGGWLNSVKVLMAFLEVAAALKFLSNVDLVWGWGVFTHDVVLSAWVVIFGLMALYVLGLFRFAHDAPLRQIGVTRVVAALVCGTIGLWLMTGLVGKGLGELEAFLPPPPDASGAGVRMASAVELPWILNDYDQALARARDDGKRVFIDFTGYTCTNCRWMEANVFPRADVRHELARFVLVRLYTDGDGALFQRQQQMQQEVYKTVALPFYAVVTAAGVPVVSFPGLTRDPARFLAFLKQAVSTPSQP